MSRLHGSLADMPTVFVNNEAESFLGQESLGSGVGLPDGTIPVYSQAIQSCSWKRTLPLQKLAPEPLQDMVRSKRFLVWRPALLVLETGEGF